jgi:phosphoribosylamine-glycine ligase
MAPLKTKTVLIHDYGQFVELAVTLSKSFGRTLYYVPWIAGGNPTSRMLRVGEGFEGVERVEELWPHIDDVDLFVFPDVYEAGLQKYLAGLGKRVWGCRGGAELELDRPASKEISKKLGVDIAPYTVITGFDGLRKHLKTHDDVFVKVSGTRGDMETFHSPDYDASEQRLDGLEHELGAHKKIMEFVVEDAINDAVEIGYDGFTIDGKFPQMALAGVEAKCKAYVGRTMRYRELPKQVRSVNDKLAPALKRYGYRGFLSTELRCNDVGAYLIDPCCRAGTPPNELTQVMIKNLAEIVWEGADGIVVEPEYRAKCGAMVLLQSEWVADNWQHVSFPDSVRDSVKLHNATIIGGEYYVVPHMDRRAQIGAVIGMGDTEDAAIEACKRNAEQVEGYTIEKPVAALDEAREQLDEILGPEKVASKLERQAEELRRAGKISDRQYEKMIEGAAQA